MNDPARTLGLPASAGNPRAPYSDLAPRTCYALNKRIMSVGFVKGTRLQSRLSTASDIASS